MGGEDLTACLQTHTPCQDRLTLHNRHRRQPNGAEGKLPRPVQSDDRRGDLLLTSRRCFDSVHQLHGGGRIRKVCSGNSINAPCVAQAAGSVGVVGNVGPPIGAHWNVAAAVQNPQEDQSESCIVLQSPGPGSYRKPHAFYGASTQAANRRGIKADGHAASSS